MGDQKKELMKTFEEKFTTGLNQLNLEIENRALAREAKRRECQKWIHDSSVEGRLSQGFKDEAPELTTKLVSKGITLQKKLKSKVTSITKNCLHALASWSWK